MVGKLKDVADAHRKCNLSKKFVKAHEVYSQLRRLRPLGRDALRNYVKVFLGIDVPAKRMCEGHSSPMDYLWHSFSSDFKSAGRINSDAVVWANRGGGKTQLAAVGTLLDCIFKAGCQVRILAGSGEQAGRMYEYLRCFLGRGFEAYLSGPVRSNRCGFSNGAGVEVLTQSSASVRGQHIHKLRCDEVELFSEDVYSAAQFTTMSNDVVLGGIE